MSRVSPSWASFADLMDGVHELLRRGTFVVRRFGEHAVIGAVFFCAVSDCRRVAASSSAFTWSTRACSFVK